MFCSPQLTHVYLRNAMTTTPLVRALPARPPWGVVSTLDRAGSTGGSIPAALAWNLIRYVLFHPQGSQPAGDGVQLFLCVHLARFISDGVKIGARLAQLGREV